jgi:hypothetical protein
MSVCFIGGPLCGHKHDFNLKQPPALVQFHTYTKVTGDHWALYKYHPLRMAYEFEGSYLTGQRVAFNEEVVAKQFAELDRHKLTYWQPL